MGYDLYITRKINSFDREGPAISSLEWQQLIEQDPDLSLDPESKCTLGNIEWIVATFAGTPGALAWDGNNIIAKNPDEPLVLKMVQIAKALGAKVQGDDGEFYREDGSSYHPETNSPAPTSPALFARIARWFKRSQTQPTPGVSVPPFRVGQRVRNCFGRPGTITLVDPKANAPLGSIRIRLDNGQEEHFALIASGLEIITDE